MMTARTLGARHHFVINKLGNLAFESLLTKKYNILVESKSDGLRCYVRSLEDMKDKKRFRKD